VLLASLVLLCCLSCLLSLLFCFEAPASCSTCCVVQIVKSEEPIHFVASWTIVDFNTLPLCWVIQAASVNTVGSASLLVSIPVSLSCGGPLSFDPTICKVVLVCCLSPTVTVASLPETHIEDHHCYPCWSHRPSVAVAILRWSRSPACHWLHTVAAPPGSLWPERLHHCVFVRIRALTSIAPTLSRDSLTPDLGLNHIQRWARTPSNKSELLNPLRRWVGIKPRREV